MSTACPSALRRKFQDYVKAWNTHSFDDIFPYYSDDIFLHLPGCPPLQGREAVQNLLENGLSFFREQLYPTFLVEGTKTLAMEAKSSVKILQDMTSVFPFTGEIYKTGDAFIYEFVVHYEFNDDLLIKTFRAYSKVLNPDAGAGITQSVLAGFDPLPEPDEN